MKPSPQHHIEYGLVRTLTCPLRRLPYRAALGVVWLFAALSFALLHRRRKAALARIRQVFGDQAPQPGARRIAWLSWRNILFNMVDILRFPAMTVPWLGRVMNTDDAVRSVRTALQPGCGAILALPHMGSWELASATATTHGLRLFSIAADQHNRLLTDYVNTLRSTHGMTLLTRGRANLREIPRRLKSGEIFAILPDLRQRTEGIPVSFLGGIANVGAGMATFARLAGVPIIPCYMTREGWTRHRFHLLEPIAPNPQLSREEDVRRMTQNVLAQIDAVIRARPEQWFWHNRRWVLDPLETKH